jgi:hypothetical protein
MALSSELESNSPFLKGGQILIGPNTLFKNDSGL